LSFGFVVLVLVLFRLVWDLVGGQHSRFVAFVQGLAEVIRFYKVHNKMFSGIGWSLSGFEQYDLIDLRLDADFLANCPECLDDCLKRYQESPQKSV
jgi:hypothetical protein